MKTSQHLGFIFVPSDKHNIEKIYYIHITIMTNSNEEINKITKSNNIKKEWIHRMFSSNSSCAQFQMSLNIVLNGFWIPN